MEYQKINSENFYNVLAAVNPQLDLTAIRKAVLLAGKAHQNQKRESGENYIIHPLTVAVIIAGLGLDASAVCTGILHDVVEDTDITAADITNEFGSEISYLVDAVTKIGYLPYSTGKSFQKAENYRKLLLAITNDVRVVFIKIADRLHNMRTLQHLNEHKQIEIAQETLEIYIPLAIRFGLQNIKRELEDLCLKYLYPDIYHELQAMINEKKSIRDAYIEAFVQEVQTLLADENLSARIFGRSKHFWSIFRKKVQLNINYNEINDYYAIRIITSSVEDCFSVLGLINTHYQPLANTYKDYITQPKPNGYSSLHQVIVAAEGSKIEVQIRTEKMHFEAEEGSAAHWKYKGFIDSQNPEKLSVIKPDKEYEEQVNWLRDLLNLYQQEQPEEFINVLKEKFFRDKIIVKTPADEYVELPIGSTPLDFAFAVHTDIGLHCLSARVNGKHASLRQQLNDGDLVEIKTARNVKPSRDWIEILSSPRARQRVRSWFRKQETEDAISLGKSIFEKEIKKNDFKLNEQAVNELAVKLKYSGQKNLFADLGQGNLMMEKVLDILSPDKEPPQSTTLPGLDRKYSSESSKSFIEIEGLENLMVHFARCCNPLPGDDIIGYITRGRGLSVHKKDCPNPAFIQLCQREPERLMHLHWQKGSNEKDFMVARLSIIALPRPKLNYEITSLLAKFKITTLTSSSQLSGDHEEMELLLEIKDRNQLKRLKNSLLKINSIIEVN
ncbi:MAG: bifunctional (p)ppGpp synthetase/guanosine-3',5'-bis(diphosphate) 3'-pyrophosphohydrolase [Candidatus Cloacimonetes bacterium]|nr:bifunctional (p)ppGpp synthetase/guanosine-3',5'-bis(diphosphate) 3'-pyrophosphohydrolase [Candidatus Cloacimonadota bacterium]